MKKVIRKVIIGYCYPRNGNLDNPTPRVRWECRDENGKLLDAHQKLSVVKDWHRDAVVERVPGATVGLIGPTTVSNN